MSLAVHFHIQLLEYVDTLWCARVMVLARVIVLASVSQYTNCTNTHNIHLFYIPGEAGFSCGVCGQQFGEVGDFQKHTPAHH